MSSKILKKEKNLVTVEFTVSAEDFEEAVNKAYLRMKNNINVQGFRKGKAPRHIIERKYGKSIFYDDALDIAVQDIYPSVVEENKLDVIDRPSINVEKFEEGEEIVITAEVQVMPEVELCEYKGVEVEKAEFKVTDEDVDNEIKSMQEQNARMVEVTDRAVEKGDLLTIDYAGTVNGEAFEGGSAENWSLEIGSNSFIPGFEDQLIGKSKDEEVTVSVTFPEDYHAEDLKGKDAEFKVMIHEIKHKELPEIDDEFAKDISEFDTLDELKADIRKTLEQKAADNEKITNDNNVITKIVQDSEVDVPDVMIEREIEYQARNYEQQFRMQGFGGKDMEGFLKSLVNQYKQNYRPQAEFSVKADLVLNAIIEKEGIKPTEEEFNAEVDKLIESYKVEPDRVEAFKESIVSSNRSYIEESIQKRKVIDMLVENAIFVEKSDKSEKSEDSEKSENKEETPVTE